MMNIKDSVLINSLLSSIYLLPDMFCWHCQKCHIFGTSVHPTRNRGSTNDALQLHGPDQKRLHINDFHLLVRVDHSLILLHSCKEHFMFNVELYGLNESRIPLKIDTEY